MDAFDDPVSIDTSDTLSCVTTPNESAPPAGEAPQDPPLPTRFGLLTFVTLAVVGIGVAVAAVMGGDGGQRVTYDRRRRIDGFTRARVHRAPLDGGEFSLSEHLADDGRPLILNLWASWCIPCREEIPEIDRVAAEHPEVAFLGVAVEDQEPAARQFAEEVGVSFPLGFDDTGNVSTRLSDIRATDHGGDRLGRNRGPADHQPGPRGAAARTRGGTGRLRLS